MTNRLRLVEYENQFVIRQFARFRLVFLSWKVRQVIIQLAQTRSKIADRMTSQLQVMLHVNQLLLVRIHDRKVRLTDFEESLLKNFKRLWLFLRMYVANINLSGGNYATWQIFIPVNDKILST